MSRRIWTKPFVKSILSGNRDEARKLERKARACVGYLFDQLMPNQKYRSQNWSYADGSSITAHVWRDVFGERARVEIFAGGHVVEIFEYTNDHGLLVTENFLESQGMIHTYKNLRDSAASAKIKFKNIDGNGVYPSATWTGDNEPPAPIWEPHKHTGLGMLWVQGLLAADVKFNDVIPVPLRSRWDPNNFTLVRGPDSRYWLCYWQWATSGGISAGMHLYEMVIPPERADILALEASIRGAPKTSPKREFIDSRILASLVPKYIDGTNAFKILAYSDLYSLRYETPLTLFNRSSGVVLHSGVADFIWTVQASGSPDEYSPAAMRTFIGYYHTVDNVLLSTRRGWQRRKTITLNWDGETNDPVTATYESSSIFGDWVIPTYKFFRRNASTGNLDDVFSWEFPVVTTGDPKHVKLWSYFDADGAIRSARYTTGVRRYDTGGHVTAYTPSGPVRERHFSNTPPPPNDTPQAYNPDNQFMITSGYFEEGFGPFFDDYGAGRFAYGMLDSDSSDGYEHDTSFPCGNYRYDWTTTISGTAVISSYSNSCTSGERFDQINITGEGPYSYRPEARARIILSESPYALWHLVYSNGKDGDYYGSFSEQLGPTTSAYTNIGILYHGNPLVCGQPIGTYFGPHYFLSEPGVDRGVDPAHTATMGWQFRAYAVVTSPSGANDKVECPVEPYPPTNFTTLSNASAGKLLGSFSGGMVGEAVSPLWLIAYPDSEFTVVGSDGLFTDSIGPDTKLGWVGGS